MKPTIIAKCYPKRWITNSDNLLSFSYCIANYNKSIILPNSVDAVAAELTDRMVQAAKEIFPKLVVNQ